MGALKHRWTKAIAGNPNGGLWLKRPTAYPNGETAKEFRWNYLTFNALDYNGPPTPYKVQSFAYDMMTAMNNHQPRGDGNCRDPFTILVDLYPQYEKVIEEAAHLFVAACLPGITGGPLW